MKKIIFPLLLLGLFACSNNPKFDTQLSHSKYPEPPRDSVVDNYFGTRVPDPYRWMENEHSDSLKQWIGKERQLYSNYMDRIPYRASFQKRLEDIWDYTKYSAPFHAGNHYFFYKNDGLQNQSVLYTSDGYDGTPRVLLDPNKLSNDGTVALSSVEPSKNGKYLAYGISRSGSDWREFYVLNTETGQQLQDHLQWIKFSSMAWSGSGFFYSRYDKPDSSSKMTGQNLNQKVYYHVLGTPQDQDQLIYQDPHHPKRTFYTQTTDDEKYLVLYISEGATNNNAFLVKDLSKPKSKLKPVITSYDHAYTVIGDIDNKLVVMTNNDAPRNRLVLIDPDHPQQKSWKTIIPEQDDVMESASIAGNLLLTEFMKDASSRLRVFDLDGKAKYDVTLPALGSVSSFGGQKQDSVIFYSFTSFTYPTTIYKYNIAQNKSTVFRKPDVKFNPDDFQTQQVFYHSKDGTRVPMFIVSKKDMKRDGTHPTLLYAYGGFDISLTPRFSVSNIALLEQGGIYALANIRGGGEYGEKWHEAGMGAHKQRVFDDFIAAAEYLKDQKYTSTDKLAIEGASNGGLLIGATMTQRPDLVRVAFPEVGVMDMLRYQKFTIGWAWVPEYGSSDDSTQFQTLYKYSPYQNIKPGTCYPATMVSTADHDDRVVPAHSFKFTARMQYDQNCDNPVIIHIETKAGHGGGKPTSKIIQEQADKWAFMFWNMQITPHF